MASPDFAAPSVLVGLALACLASCVPVGAAAGAAGGQAARDAAAALDAVASCSPAERVMWSSYLVEAAVANGREPASWPADHPALEDVGVGPGTSWPGLLRPLHALARAGAAGNLTERVLAGFTGGQFGDPARLNDDVWAILGLRAAGVSTQDDRIATSVEFVRGHADPGGGWPWAVGGVPDADSTGMAMAALAGLAGLDAGAVWLASMAHAGGGFGALPGQPPNCDSTVWAIRGLWAAGRDPPAGAWAYLASLRGGTGLFAYQYGVGPDLLCTLEVATLLGDAASGNHDLSGYARQARPVPGGLWVPVVALAAAVAAQGLRPLRERCRKTTPKP